jgi:hypothetical protein
VVIGRIGRYFIFSRFSTNRAEFLGAVKSVGRFLSS